MLFETFYKAMQQHCLFLLFIELLVRANLLLAGAREVTARVSEVTAHVSEVAAHASEVSAYDNEADSGLVGLKAFIFFS